MIAYSTLFRLSLPSLTRLLAASTVQYSYTLLHLKSFECTCSQTDPLKHTSQRPQAGDCNSTHAYA